MLITLDGVAVVTGGAKGIGAAIAAGMNDAGAKLAVVDVDAAAANEVAQKVKGHAFVCDVTDKQAVAATAKAIHRQLGPVRYLINNAGIVSPPGQPFTQNSEDDWDQTFAVNVKASVFWAGALRDDLIATQGRVVNITSIVGVIAAPFLPPYSVSKTAANGMTRVLARQLAPEGVTVNAIAPGYVWSPLWEDLGATIADVTGGALGETAQAVFDSRVRDLIPMGRSQSPEEIAAMAVFLCSHSARNITGQIIGVDGGVTI